MEKYLKYGIFAGVFALLFVPFLVSSDMFFPFITGKNFAFRIIVEIIFALWIILALKDVSVRPRRTGLWVALLLFIGSLGVSALIGENSHKSFWSNFERMDGWITLIHLGAFFTVLTSTLRSEKMWRAFFNTSIVASVIMALYGVAQLAGMFTINQGGVRVDGTFGNATYLAVYMLFHFFITLWALVKWNTARWLQIGYGVALILQALMIFYAATRGTILGLVGGLFLSGLIFVVFSKGNNTLRKAGAGLAVAILLVAGGFYLVKDADFVRNNDVLTRIASISLEEGQTRFTIWNMALEGAKERPVFGWGQENFNYVFNENYKASMYGQEPWFDRAHNIYLDWLVAGGALGLLLYLSLFAFALWYLWKPGSVFDVSEKAVFTGLLAGYGFHNLFVFDNLFSYVFFIAILSYIAYRYSQNLNTLGGEKTVGNSAYPVVSGAIVVLLIVTVYFANVPGMTRAAGIIDGIKPYQEGLERNLEEFKQVIGPNGLGRQEAHEQLIQFASQIQRQDLQSLSTEEFRQEVINYTKEKFEEEVRRQPNDARLRLFLGSFLRLSGFYEEAEMHLLKALELSPEKQAIMFELGSVAQSQGDANNTIRWFKTAYELEPLYDRARLHYAATLIRVGEEALADQIITERFDTPTPAEDILLQAYIDTGNVPKMTAIAEARVEKNPTNVNYRTQLAGLYLDTGRRQDAIQALRDAAEVNPAFKPDADRFIEDIEAGRI